VQNQKNRLAACGHKVELLKLETTEDKTRERAWIDFFDDLGISLVNIALQQEKK
jgi:hypothetical protein